MAKLVPTHLVPVGYFVFFCSGYFLRKVILPLPEKRKKQLILIGCLAWVLDIVTNYFGVASDDPCDYWFWIVIALFILFDRIEISSDSLPGRVICWTGKRSYSIYLLQFSSIAFVANTLYNENMLGVVSEMPGLMRLGVWIVLVLASYGLSLALASTLDIVALKPVQKGCRWIQRHVPRIGSWEF